MTKAFGRPEAYGQYVARVAHVLGANCFAIRDKGDSVTFSENTWCILDVDEGVSFINRRIEQWAKGESFPLRSLR